VRGQLARHRYESMKRDAASLIIQKQLHMYLSKSAYKTTYARVVCIQAGMRGMTARNELRFRRWTQAATVNQRCTTDVMEEKIPTSSGEMGEAESGGASLSSIGTNAMKHRIAYFYEPSIDDYYYSQGHPMKPHRINMAHNLIIHYPVFRDFSQLPKKPPDRCVATRTLTLNQMKVTKFWFGREPLKEVHIQMFIHMLFN